VLCAQGSRGRGSNHVVRRPEVESLLALGRPKNGKFARLAPSSIDRCKAIRQFLANETNAVRWLHVQKLLT